MLKRISSIFASARIFTCVNGETGTDVQVHLRGTQIELKKGGWAQMYQRKHVFLATKNMFSLTLLHDFRYDAVLVLVFPIFVPCHSLL